MSDTAYYDAFKDAYCFEGEVVYTRAEVEEMRGNLSAAFVRAVERPMPDGSMRKIYVKAPMYGLAPPEEKLNKLLLLL